MAKTDWEVLPHGELEPLAENLWRVEGELPGMKLRRCMVVGRAPDGRLVLHSAIAMDEAHMAQLEGLGRPTWLVVPNGWHRLDAARYKARYPDLKVICPAQVRKAVEQKVAVDGNYDDFAQLDEAGTLRLEHFDAERHVEGALVVESQDGQTLVFADSLFNLPHQPGLYWFVYGRLLGATGGPRVTLIGRVMMVLSRSKRAYRTFLQNYAQGGRVVRLVPGHGAVVDQDAQAVLEQLVASL